MNIVAVIYGVVMLINIGWPRDEVYDIEGNPAVLHHFPLIFMAATVLIGAIADHVIHARRATALYGARRRAGRRRPGSGWAGGARARLRGTSLARWEGPVGSAPSGVGPTVRSA